MTMDYPVWMKVMIQLPVKSLDSVSVMANKMDVGYSHFFKIIKALEDQNYITRVYVDGKQKLIQLTPDGIKKQSELKVLLNE